VHKTRSGAMGNNLMKYLQQVGLVSTLLTGGVLGGLIAPLPSDAAPPSTAPTVSVQMDTGTPLVLTTTLSTCLSGDISPGGYNYCYAVPVNQTVGTSPKQFQIQANGTPRVRVADKNGMDKMSLIGVKFVPVGSWSNSESHTLTITVSGTLDATTDPTGADPNATINATNAGIYKYALRSAGEFNANSGSDSVNNSIVLTGTGTFSTTNTDKPILSTSNPAERKGTKNLTPLNFTIKGPAATADINWAGLSNTDMGQVDPYYPEFDCRRDYGANQNTAACRPTITQTLVATIIGMDTLKVLSGPLDMFGVLCTETFGVQSTKQIKFLTTVNKFLKWIVPYIQYPAKKAKIQELIIKIDAILVAANAPISDLSCPGEKVLTFQLALEAGIDGSIIASDTSVPGIPAAPHDYLVVDTGNTPMTWVQANNAANSLESSPGVCWHLATITSAAEQAIINGLLPPSSVFAGTTQDYWIGGKQQSEAGEPDGNWEWVNNEGIFWNSGPFGMMYANWGSTSTGPANEPNNFNGNENHLTVDSRYGWGWNDLNNDGTTGTTKGYIAEGEPCPPVIP
jgi:hypothetical protein